MTEDLAQALRRAVEDAAVPPGTSQRAFAAGQRARQRTTRLRVIGTVIGVAILGTAGLLVLGATHEPRATRLVEDPKTRSPLYVSNGTRVHGYGYIVSTTNGSRMCISHQGPSIDPGFSPGYQQDPPTKCEGSIALTGLDPSELPAVEGGRAGNFGFRGVWHDGAVEDARLVSERFDRVTVGPKPFDDAEVPCPPPAGGWPTRGFRQEDYPPGLQADNSAHPGDAMMTAIMYPSSTTPVLGVTSTDEAAAARVRALLTPRYGKALCVVVSKVSQTDLELALQGPPTSDPSARNREQAAPAVGLSVTVPWNVTVVDDKVQAALDRLPPGLITLTATIAPDDTGSVASNELPGCGGPSPAAGTSPQPCDPRKPAIP
jgi:hypothetical protein